MNKTEVVTAVIKHTTAQPVVFTTGYSCRIAQGVGDRDNHFYMTGSMGLAANIGHGIALGSGLPVFIVDGDGSITMNPSALLGIGQNPDLPIVHLVLDDGCYDSTGGQPVLSTNLDLCALARASGYQHTEHINDLDHLDQLLALRSRSGTQFLHCLLAPDPTPLPPRVSTALPHITDRFTRHVGTQIDLHADP